MDSNGVILDSIKPRKKDWKTLDYSIQDQLTKNSNIGAKNLINYLNNYRLKIDRCQEISSLNNDTFLVSYYLYYSTLNSVDYFIDFFTSKNDKISVLKQGVPDIKNNPSHALIDADYPSQHTYNAHLFVRNKLIIIKSMAPSNYWGKTLLQIQDIEEIHFAKNNGFLGFFIFDLQL
jgi:hypothetical protein